MLHVKYGHIWNVAAGRVWQGRRCPKCNASHCELAIAKWLEKDWCPPQSSKLLEAKYQFWLVRKKY